MNTYFLVREYRRNGTLIMEYVLQYSAGDIAEVFNAAEALDLANGRVVERDAKYGAGKITFTNMVVAAREAETVSRALAA